MKLLQFIFLLVRHGSLFQKPIDFEAKRRALLASVPLSDPVVIPAPDGKRSRRHVEDTCVIYHHSQPILFQGPPRNE